MKELLLTALDNLIQVQHNLSGVSVVSVSLYSGTVSIVNVNFPRKGVIKYLLDSKSYQLNMINNWKLDVADIDNIENIYVDFN